MNKFFLILLVLSPFLRVQAQEQQAKIVLKNGTELIGEVVSVNPLESVKINIAGFETEIKMDDVVRIETIKDNAYINKNPNVSSEYMRTCELAESSNKEMPFSEHLALVYGDLNHFLNKKQSFRTNLELPLLRIEGETFEQYAQRREGGWRQVFNKEIEAAIDAFILKWNSKMKGIRGKKNDADMTMNLYITEMDLGSNSAGIWGIRTIDGGASMSGYVELVDNKTNEVLSIVRITNIKGLGNNGITIYKEGNRIKKVFEKLAIKMAEDITK